MSCDSIIQTEKALQKHDMNLCEYVVLCRVHDRIGASPEELANHSQWASEGDPRGFCTRDEHISAVQSCMKKGLLIQDSTIFTSNSSSPRLRASDTVSPAFWTPVRQRRSFPISFWSRRAVLHHDETTGVFLPACRHRNTRT